MGKNAVHAEIKHDFDSKISKLGYCYYTVYNTKWVRAVPIIEEVHMKTNRDEI